jgi:hypothetical protein
MGFLRCFELLTFNLVSHKGALISHKTGVNSTLSLTSLCMIHWNKMSFPWAPWSSLGAYFSWRYMHLNVCVWVQMLLWGSLYGLKSIWKLIWQQPTHGIHFQYVLRTLRRRSSSQIPCISEVVSKNEANWRIPRFLSWHVCILIRWQ